MKTGSWHRVIFYLLLNAITEGLSQGGAFDELFVIFIQYWRSDDLESPEYQKFLDDYTETNAVITSVQHWGQYVPMSK